MAQIAAANARAAESAKLSREGMKSRERSAAQELQFGRERLSELGRQKDIEADIERQKLATKTTESPFSYQNLGSGKVLKVNKQTGNYEEIDFPELRKTKKGLQALEDFVGGGEFGTAPSEEAPANDWNAINDLVNPAGGAGSRTVGGSPQVAAPRNVMTMGDTVVRGNQEPQQLTRYVLQGGNLVRQQ